MTLALPKRKLVGTIFVLATITLLSWLYLTAIATDMPMSANVVMSAMQTQTWDLHYFFMMYLMWAIMMIGMMLPSVTPTVLIYAAVSRKAKSQGNSATSTGTFVLGYIVMWLLFSLAATLAQWGLDQAALLSPMMKSNSNYLAACLLVIAGIYQYSPLKQQCLHHCRNPMLYISSHWQPGNIGALKMGISHGIYCLGCCWVLMLLLFVGGVMNLLWIAALTIFVLLEKVLPFGDIAGRALGVGMIISGIAVATLL